MLEDWGNSRNTLLRRKALKVITSLMISCKEMLNNSFHLYSHCFKVCKDNTVQIQSTDKIMFPLYVFILSSLILLLIAGDGRFKSVTQGLIEVIC